MPALGAMEERRVTETHVTWCDMHEPATFTQFIFPQENEKTKTKWQSLRYGFFCFCVHIPFAQRAETLERIQIQTKRSKVEEEVNDKHKQELEANSCQWQAYAGVAYFLLNKIKIRWERVTSLQFLCFSPCLTCCRANLWKSMRARSEPSGMI